MDRARQLLGPAHTGVVLAGVVLAGVVLAAAVLAGCGRSADVGTVRVSWGDAPEDRLLGEIYATGLQIRGVDVERSIGLGGRDGALARVRDGAADLVPQRTGDLLRALDPGSPATTPDEVYRQARLALPPALTLLDRARAETEDVVVVPRAVAGRGALRSLADLAPSCAATTAVGAPGFPLAALAAGYGCRFRSYRPLDAPGTVAALRDGQAQAGVLTSTDPAIPGADLVPLDDPRSVVTAQNVVPLIVTAKTGDPRVTEVLNKISSQLDTAVLADLDRRLTGPDALPPAQVARDWLASAGVG